MKNYLLYGTDDLLLENEMKKLYHGEDQVVHFDTFNISMLLEEASFYSLFDEKKIMIVDLMNIDSLNDEQLKAYLINPNPNTILVFLLHIDKLEIKKKTIREVVEHLKVIQCKKLVGFELSKYVVQSFEKDHYKIDKLAVNILLNMTKENLHYIENEIQKLKLYRCKEKIITKEDVEMLSSRNLEDNLFELLNMVTAKNKNGIFTVYQDLILMGEEPIKMIVTLAGQLRLIYQVKYYTQIENKQEEEIAKILGIHPYRVKLAKEKIFDFSGKELLQNIHKLATLDVQIKTGKIDKNLGMELFFLQL